MPQFHKEDLKYIEKIVTKVKKQELKQRTVFPYDSNFPAAAREIGYDIYDITGSAKILADGADAKDIPFVGETKQRKSQGVYTIASGIRYSKAERDAVAMARQNGRGASYNLDAERPAAARRYIYETECEVIFNGSAKYGIKGIFDSSYYGTNKGTLEDVADGAAASKTWASKTPPEILEDIRTAVTKASADGLFDGKKVILVSFASWRELVRPFSEDSSFTVMDWIKRTEEVEFQWFNALKAANNETGENVLFCFTKDPMLVKMALPEDIRLGRPVFDILETSEQALTERFAGPVVKHPASLYVGKGI